MALNCTENPNSNRNVENVPAFRTSYGAEQSMQANRRNSASWDVSQYDQNPSGGRRASLQHKRTSA
jgi:hypothetical protein